MTFGESIRVCMTKYAIFEGRASRSEYWWFFLFSVLVQTGASAISNGLGVVAMLVLLLPGIAVGARRLHDIGRSAWWLLVGFIPIVGWLILIYWFVKPGLSDQAGTEPTGTVDRVGP